MPGVAVHESAVPGGGRIERPRAAPVRQTTRRSRLIGPTLLTLSAALWFAATAQAHTQVAKMYRAGASPPYHGSGWRGEAFIHLPDDAAVSQITADAYVAGRTPDFTFRTPWIDFPAGPVGSGLDSSFDTIGDFLNDYIYDVSDPSKLDEPFGHIYLRFKGLVKISIEDEVRVPRPVGLPIWVDFAIQAYDAYRLSVQWTILRVVSVEFVSPWSHFGPSLEVLGLFPIEVTYLNKYDPNGVLGTPRVGIEVYSFHGSEKDWPAGFQMFHEVFGFGTLLPPRLIYQPEDVLPVEAGDFEADADLDLKDFQWLQICGDPSFELLPSNCDAFDFDGDERISATDLQSFVEGLSGPAGASVP